MMGGSPAKRVGIENVTEVKPSKYGGLGLFATSEMQPNTLLIENPNTTRPLNTFCNDGGFSFPNKFDYSSFRLAFQTYQEEKNNVIADIKQQSWKTRKRIQIGEELTKGYGLLKWSYFLSSTIDSLPVQEQLKGKKALKKALAEHGLIYEFKGEN